MFGRKKIEVKYYKIKKPKKDEILFFQFPEDTSPNLMADFRDKMEEGMKNGRNNIIFSGDMEMCITPRPKINWKEYYKDKSRYKK